MKKTFPLLIAVLMVISTGWGGQDRPDQNKSFDSVSQDFLFNNVVVILSDGKLVSGLLVAMSSWSLVIRTGGRDEAVDFKSMSRVSIAKEPKEGQGALYGALVGAYFGTLLLNRPRNQPTAFMPSQMNWLWPLISFLVGGAAGYPLGSVLEKDSLTIDFPANDYDRRAEWEKLRKILSGSKAINSRNFHLAVYGGKVFLNIVNRYSDIFKKAGCYVHDYEYGYYPFGYAYPGVIPSGSASSLNLLRRLQFTVSLTPRLETGLAVIFLGEPAVSGSGYRNSKLYFAGVRLDSTGYYALGLYQPLQGILPRRLQWKIGLGVGAAKVNFDLKTYYGAQSSTYPYTWVHEEDGHAISRWCVSGDVLTEFHLALSSFFSLGLAADYAWMPAQQVPEFPNFQIPAQKIALGNASLGAVLAFHF